MNKQGFIDFNARNSTKKSGKAYSYAKAIEILDKVLKHQNVVKLSGQSLYDINDPIVIEEILNLVKVEVKKMRNQEPNIFDYGDPTQKSYPLDNYCSAALGSLKEYAQYEQDIAADAIVTKETSPGTISKKLLTFFDVTKEGEDEITKAKHRRGQDYFRRMILKFYDGKCALTGINVEPLLLASHIIPWRDESHKKERLNPCNGICLSALYDKAFDKGLITISPDDYKVSL
jgi:putative restriction endonuclease